MMHDMKITQEKESLFRIYFSDLNYFSLMRSIKHMLNNGICSQIKNSLLIKANNIRFYKDFIKEQKTKNGTFCLSHQWCLRLLYSLSEQTKYLIEKESKCFYQFDFEHLLVIDDYFFYVSNEHLREIEDEHIQIYSVLEKKNGCFSPELCQTNCMPPISIHYKTIYYSLALLIISASLYKKIDVLNKDMFEKLCKPIKESKLYYFLIRCLHEDIHKRTLLYL